MSTARFQPSAVPILIALRPSLHPSAYPSSLPVPSPHRVSLRRPSVPSVARADFLTAAACSSTQLLTPFALAAHASTCRLLEPSQQHPEASAVHTTLCNSRAQRTPPSHPTRPTSLISARPHCLLYLPAGRTESPHPKSTVTQPLCCYTTVTLRPIDSLPMFYMPHLRDGYATVMQPLQVPTEGLISELRRLHAQLDSQLSATAPARRASMQQGAALARVGSHWLAVGDACGDRTSLARSRKIASELHLGGRAHGAIVLGVLVALLELPAGAVELGLAHSSSRDLLSAAVSGGWWVANFSAVVSNAE